MDNDATSVYDCILLLVSSLTVWEYRIRQNIMLAHAATFSEATYKQGLFEKVTESEYKHYIKIPIHGSGQGSACLPQIWAFISSRIFDANNNRANGMLFQSPDGKMSLRITIIGFVDGLTVVTRGDLGKPDEFFGTNASRCTTME